MVAPTAPIAASIDAASDLLEGSIEQPLIVGAWVLVDRNIATAVTAIHLVGTLA